MKRYPRLVLAIIAALVLQTGACGSTATREPKSGVGSTASPTPRVAAATATIPASTATPKATTTPPTYGPALSQFPAGINPLTGERVVDPSLLKIPAVLISVSHFPATARPQAGLSFAPFVYEFSITGGETRFLAAFYGQFPAPEVPLKGDCVVRRGVFTQTGTLLGGRVWLDANRNGTQDLDEQGIPGVCVGLIDEAGAQIETTTTDTNGYYGFNVEPGRGYSMRFERPSYLEFTSPNVGPENTDSDAAPDTGETPPITADGDQVRWDAGLFPDDAFAAPTPDPRSTPRPEVGPVRSGRVLYAYIGAFYQNSCLIYAFASAEVLPLLPHCAFVAHETAGGGEMLSIQRMQAVAQDNMRHTTSHPFDYASNAYSELPPAGGSPASQLKVFFGNLDQSGWTYDPLYQAYLRFVDNADPKARGVLHADVDRLTGRQLHFENVIVIMADADVISPTILDVHLDEGNTGPAYLFRDGQIFSIAWSTRAGQYEKTTGLRRPLQFLNTDGSPAPLRPGHTWIIIVTPFSSLQPEGTGIYQITYAPPAGEAR